MSTQKTHATTTPSKTKALAAGLRKRSATLSGDKCADGDDPFDLIAQSLRRLFYKALPRDPISQLARDPGSMRKLIRAASLATELVERLYILRRVQVIAISSNESSFPILHSRGQAAAAKCNTMIADLKLRSDKPFKPRGNRESDIVYRFIEEVAFPLMESVRQENGALAMADGKPRKVPQLNLKTAKRWSSIVADWFGPLLVHDADEAYVTQLANSRRKLDEKMRRMLERLTQRLGIGGKMSPETTLRVVEEQFRSGKLTVLEATKAQARVERFKKMKPTQRDVIRGFKEAIHARLKSMLEK